MKRFSNLVLLLCLFITVKAQQTEQLWSEDSSKIIQLTELQVKSKLSKQQYLLQFYKANTAATLEEIMSRLPELSLIRRGAYGMEPGIRSFNGGQINLLIDGMRIQGACTDKMDPASIYVEPVNLENIQIQTSANGFLYGSSVGGTINMKMAEPDFTNNKQLKGFVTSGYQTAAKSFYESAVLNYAIGKWAFRASGTYRNSSSYKSGRGSVVPFSQFEKVNASFAVKYKINAFTSVKTDMLIDDGWNIGYAGLPMDVGSAKARLASVTLQQEKQRRPVTNWMLKAYANSIKHFMDDTKRPNVPIHMDMPGYSNTVGFIGEAEIKINTKQKLQLRADAASNFVKASMTMYEAGQLPMYMLTWPDNRKLQKGIGFAWMFAVDSLHAVQISARIDHTGYQLSSQEAKDQLSGLNYASTSKGSWLKNTSVRFTKKISANSKFTGGVSFSERMPTASELYGFYLFNRSDNHDYIGNLYLKNEQSLHAELSFSYSKAKNKLQLTVYHTKLFNYIGSRVDASFSTMTVGAAGVKTFINLPSAQISGAEANAVVELLPTLNLVSTVRYIYASDYAQDPLPFISPLKNNTAVRYQQNKLSLQLETETALAQNRFNSSAGEDATKGFMLLHLRSNYETTLLWNNVIFSGGIENIFNCYYWDHLDWGNVPRPGRNIYLQVKFSF